jgi:hypothetical protein
MTTFKNISKILFVVVGTAVAQWLRFCATNRKVAGSIPDGDNGFFCWHYSSDRTMALGSTQPLTEMSKEVKQSRYRPGVAQRVSRFLDNGTGLW